MNNFDAKKQRLFLRRSLTMVKIKENHSRWQEQNNNIWQLAHKMASLSIFANNK